MLYRKSILRPYIMNSTKAYPLEYLTHYNSMHIIDSCNPKFKIIYLVSIFLCKILCTLLSLKRNSFQLAIQRSFRGHKYFEPKRLPNFLSPCFISYISYWNYFFSCSVSLSLSLSLVSSSGFSCSVVLCMLTTRAKQWFTIAYH